MRKDLNMRKGKMIAQGAHASMKVLLNLMHYEIVPMDFDITTFNRRTLITLDNNSLEDWLRGRFTKVCLSVDSEAELDEIYDKAKEAGLRCTMIVDAGLTEFNGNPTKTCCAIGPEWSEDIDKITGHLKLL